MEKDTLLPRKASRGLCSEQQQTGGIQRQLEDSHPLGPSEEVLWEGRVWGRA